MVVDDGLADEAIDHLFHALADATRRDILRRCARTQPSVSRLADAYPISLTAVQKGGWAWNGSRPVVKLGSRSGKGGSGEGSGGRSHRP